MAMTDNDDARAMRIWRRRTTIFSICILIIFAFVVILFGTGDGEGDDGTLPLPVSLAGLLLVYAVYAYFDLQWVRKNQHTLTDRGFTKKDDR